MPASRTHGPAEPFDPYVPTESRDAYGTPAEHEPSGPMRIGGHHSDFDELSWHLTYRAAQAAKDPELPQSEAEAKFVAQMLGHEPIHPESFPNRIQAGAQPDPATLHATREKSTALRVLLVALVGSFLILLVPVLLRAAFRPAPVAAPIHDTPMQLVPSPTATPSPPSYNFAPYDRKGVDVIAEMLSIAVEANPGLIWLTSQTPELTACTMPSGQDGEVAALTIRWSMGDYDAINEPDATAGLTHWRLIQQANDAADDRFIEAWMGHPIDDERSPVSPEHGNWYFGYVFPGISGGVSKFDTQNGEGILSLETLCLQPSSADSGD